MKLYELVQKNCLIRDMLKNFSFCLIHPNTEDFYHIPEPTGDDFIRLCDREVEESDFYPEDGECLTLTAYILTDLDKDFGIYWRKQQAG